LSCSLVAVWTDCSKARVGLADGTKVGESEVGLSRCLMRKREMAKVKS